ncbi:MAG: hypothetical protein ABI091_29970 [Ferruginibacter sp.]
MLRPQTWKGRFIRIINKVFIFNCLLIIPFLFQANTTAAQTVSSQEYPSLIPYPKQLKWTSDKFYLKTAKAIIVESKELSAEAIYLQQLLAGKKEILHLPIPLPD